MELFHSQVEILKLTRRDNEQDDLVNDQDNLVNDDDVDQNNLINMMKLFRAEEEEVSAPLGSQLLSPFQKDKFTHFFYHVLDVNR